jgi:ElaA protein
MLEFDIQHFDQLTAREVYDVMHLRDVVFVVGQKITAVPEVDGLDPECAHARAFDDGRLVGTARIFVDRRPMSVGRVAVHPDFQGQGIGTRLMEYVQSWLGARPAELHAQAHLEKWYADLGWERVGEQFVEAEIPHVTMVWNAQT